MSEGSGNEGRGGTHTALRRTDRTRLEPHFDLYTEPACSGYNQTGNYVTCGDRRGDRTLRSTDNILYRYVWRQPAGGALR